MRETIWDVCVVTGQCNKDDIQTILQKCTVNIDDYDKDYIQTLYNAHMNRYLLEYVYKLTIYTIKESLINMGERLMKSLCYVIDKGAITGIPDVYLLGLATKLELLSKSEQLRIVELMELLQIHNYYNSASSVTSEQTDYYLRVCFDAVLFKDYSPFANSFKQLVDKLKNTNLVPLSVEYISIINATHHEKTIIARTLCDLLFNVEQEENNQAIINNFKLLMPALWESINASDKLFFSYYFKRHPEETTAKKVFAEISTSVIKIPDFATDISVVKQLIENGQDAISCHYSINNRRNEISALSIIKEHIYLPAVFSRSIITPALIGYMGNSYGYLKESRHWADYILYNISNEKWIYYLKNYFMYDNNILLKLVSSKQCLEEWCNIVKKYVDEDLEVDNDTIENLLNLSRQRKYAEVYEICCKLYLRKQTISEDFLTLKFN